MMTRNFLIAWKRHTLGIFRKAQWLTFTFVILVIGFRRIRLVVCRPGHVRVRVKLHSSPVSDSSR
jgi:hypothetical protein